MELEWGKAILHSQVDSSWNRKLRGGRGDKRPLGAKDDFRMRGSWKKGVRPQKKSRAKAQHYVACWHGKGLFQGKKEERGYLRRAVDIQNTENTGGAKGVRLQENMACNFG